MFAKLPWNRLRKEPPAQCAAALAWPPGHFYSPIPDLDAINLARDRVFAAISEDIPGLAINDAGQLEFFEHLCLYYDPDVFPENAAERRRFHYNNDNFRHGEALVLSSTLRHIRPKRVIEVGSGYSSCALLDVRDDLGKSFDCTFVEPYPELLESLIWPGDRAEIEIVAKPVQEVDTEVFCQLATNDILFIDSTHVLKTDNDVTHHLFRILPALKSGVLVHFHDVFYPFEYPAEWVFQGRA